MSAVFERGVMNLEVPSDVRDGFWETPEAKRLLQALEKEFEESKPQPLPETDSGFGFL